MIETHFGDSCQGSVSGDVAADVGVVLVGAHNHCGGIPADEALDAALEGAVARVARLALRRKGIEIGRIRVDGRNAPLSRALSIKFSSKKWARSTPSRSITASSESSHLPVFSFTRCPLAFPSASSPATFELIETSTPIASDRSRRRNKTASSSRYARLADLWSEGDADLKADDFRLLLASGTGVSRFAL